MQEFERELALNSTPVVKESKPARAPQPIAKGDDTVYLGKGRTIKDDLRK